MQGEISGRTTMKAFLFLLHVLPLCKAHFNLYLTHAEVRRILGLKAELFYVREGVVNDYAMGWTVPIPSHVHSLFFTWEALIRKPVLYNMAIWTNNTEISKSGSPLFEPSLNISLTGNIPSNPSTFRLNLPCTGLMNAEVDVILNINVTSPRPEVSPTVLFFRRRKICMEGESSELYQPRQDPSEEEADDSLPILYLAVSSVSGTTLVFLVVMAVALYRRRKIQSKTEVKNMQIGSVSVVSTKERGQHNPHHHHHHHTTSSSFLESSTPNNNLYTLPSSITVNSYASLHKTPIAYFTPTLSVYSCRHSPVNTYTYAHPMGSKGSEEEASSVVDSAAGSSVGGSSSVLNMDEDSLEGEKPPKEGSGTRKSGTSTVLPRQEVVVDPSTIDFREKFKMLQIERQRIRITAVTHEGKFGRIYRGWVQGDKRKLDQQVVIKSLREGSPPEEEVNLCREGGRLFNFLHKNILSLHGVSFSDNVPTFLIYADPGSVNLKMYLRDHKDKPSKTSEVVDLGLQAACGLDYLHSANVLHADIAARNCVVNEHHRLRITDAALAIDLFPADYEHVGLKGTKEPPKPIKWMAYEVLTDRLLSTASDVWSYGVLLWELLTQAQQPYTEVDAKDMADYLREGYRLAQPRQCPDDLYQLMAYCWAAVPYDRPRAERILTYMKEFEQKLKTFV